MVCNWLLLAGDGRIPLDLRHFRVAFVTVWILSLTSWSVSARQTPAPGEGGWFVAYDHLDSLFERSLSGKFEFADGHLRFRAMNRQLAWDVALEDVISIKTEDVTNPLRVRVRSIVIESREGNRDVRRRIAPIDDQLQFVPPIVLSALMKDRWRQKLTVLSSRRQN
jgi:hypothetical protein